jgi:hypothetical protein
MIAVFTIHDYTEFEINLKSSLKRTETKRDVKKVHCRIKGNVKFLSRTKGSVKLYSETKGYLKFHLEIKKVKVKLSM